MISIHPIPNSREYQEQDRKELRSLSVLVPCEIYPHPEIQIYNDKVNIVSWKNKARHHYREPEIADALGRFSILVMRLQRSTGKSRRLKRK